MSFHDEYGMTSLTLYVSPDGNDFHAVTFEAESMQWLDQQASDWLAERPYLEIYVDDDVNWGQLPHTFRTVYTSAMAQQLLVA